MLLKMCLSHNKLCNSPKWSSDILIHLYKLQIDFALLVLILITKVKSQMKWKGRRAYGFHKMEDAELVKYVKLKTVYLTYNYIEKNLTLFQLPYDV